LKTVLYILFFSVIASSVMLHSCKSPEGNNTAVEKKQDTLLYKNHHDSAKYVGINTCKLCHQSIYNTFINTGMGKSFDVASKSKSASDYHTSVIHDKIGDFYYKAFWKNDSLRFLEYRLKGRDTIYKRLETVNYIIGSGQHTNSHIQSVNGYLNQMPMTFYTQKKTWDLPPGFENGHNSRFIRKIGLECMSCHNSYPDFVLGSENKYNSVEKGIGCERCHGPGSIHVAERSTGSKIDTAKYIDYSIVNPAKLGIESQFDICQRCHLQGNTILKEGKSFYDFKPGMKLSDYMTVFLPKYKNADDEFIMASHADRLKQSACFIKSLEKSKNTKVLKPYKEALTCITCHNPHVSVRETNKNVFNDACRKCHYEGTGGAEDERLKMKDSRVGSVLTCNDLGVVQKIKNKSQIVNCVGCHMPISGSIDIPHVSVHDHYIRKPQKNSVSKKDKHALKQFIGLYAINEKNPNAFIKAKAYLNQYEKFEPRPYYLDSAAHLLKDKTDAELKTNLEPLVQLHFIKQNFAQIISYANRLTDAYVLNTKLITTSYSNDNAWACYRIAEAFYSTGHTTRAIIYFKKAVALAPLGLEFKNKLGSALAANGQLAEAEKQYTEILQEFPKHVSALTNLGFLKLQRGDILASQTLYFKALALDPDYEPLLLNIAGLYAYKKDFIQSKIYLERILKRNPNNIQAKQALSQIKQLSP
jgi:Tfp pilus assembly protein PilF/ribosomal protein L37AE/L43A